MSHRKRPQRESEITPPSLREKAVQASGLFIRENVRMMLLIAGLATLAQAVLPWSNNSIDRVPFIIAGSVFLGLGIPRRMWR